MTLEEAKTIIDLLRDTLAIQAELLKRSEYQVKQLKEELVVTTNDLIKAQEQNVKLHKEVSELKEGFNIIDPYGTLRLEYL